MLNNSFKTYYYPQQELSVAEQMIGSKNRVSFLQYIPKKPKRFGINVWALCEATTGYCQAFHIYKAKSDTPQLNGLGHRVVFELMEGYPNKNHHVYFDNFYTSLKLVQDLGKAKTLSCGTVRVGRGEFPPDLKTTKLAKGESKHLVLGNILAVKWKHKKEVHIILSIHGIKYENARRRGVDKCD